MLAARAYEGEQTLRLEEVDQPSAADGEAVIKVESAGLAPGVLHQWYRGMYPVLPRTLGNEAAGTVAEVGPGVTGFKSGDRVRLHPNISCGACTYCLTDREQMCPGHSIIGQGPYGPTAMPMHKRYLDGALAEYVKAPATCLDHLSPEVSCDAAAKVHDIADALRALKTAAPEPGATVVLTAASGTIGTSFVRLAPMFGVRRVIAVGRSTERLEQVQALAPDLVEVVGFDALAEDWAESQGLTQRLRELCPAGVDHVVDFLPEGPGTWQAVASLRTGGGAVLMGSNTSMPSLPTIAVMVNCWRLTGTRGCTREDARQTLSWIEQGALEVDDLITHRFPLTEIASAEAAVNKRHEPTWMVVVHP